MSENHALDKPILFEIDQAADYLNVSVRMIRRMVEEKRVAYIKIGKLIRIDKRDIDAYLAAQRIEAL
jgi:excisionase family DNA binding protein